MSGSRIGKNCNLGQNVVVSSNVVLGNNVKVQNNVSIYEGVICEDDVFLGPSVVLTNVINPRSAIVRKHEYKKTLIKKGASIGANATIVCGYTIGEYAFIGAGAVVTRLTGEGKWAETVQRIFETNCNKYNLNKEKISLDTHLFSIPTDFSNKDQLEMFI